MSLDSVLKSLNKKYSNSILDLRNGKDSIPEVERIPIEHPGISELLGGGLPVGRVVEFYGDYSSGKSSLAEYICGQVQKADCKIVDENGDIKLNKDGIPQTRKGVVVYVDTENAISLDYAKIHGLNVENMILVQPESGEEALDIIKDLIESREIDCIVLDSVSATTPKAEIEGEMGDATIGLQARLFSKFFRIVSRSMLKYRVTLICINQIRDKIGTYGSPVETSGGKALKFYSSIRIETKRKEYILDKDTPKGIIISAKSVKNKTAPPMVKKLLKMYFDSSFDSFADWIEIACKYDVVKVGGAGWCEIPTIKDGNIVIEKLQGLETKVKDFYKQNKESFEYLQNEVKKYIGSGEKQINDEGSDVIEDETNVMLNKILDEGE